MDIEVPVLWGSVGAVELTAGAAQAAATSDDVAQTVGNTYVIDAAGHVKLAANNDTVTKSQKVTFTLDATIANMKRTSGTAATVADLNQLTTPQTYSVSVYATGNIRLATSRLGGTSSDKDYVDAYVERTYVPVGKVTVSHVNNATTVEYAYDADSKATSTSTDAGESIVGNLGFYYSVSPLNNVGTGEYSGNDSTDKHYGKIYVSLKSGNAYDTGVAPVPAA